jgi:hypothetical protein
MTLVHVKIYERSGVLLGIPVPCSLEAFTSLPKVAEFMLIYLRDLFLSVRSLTESTGSCQVGDCLRQSLDSH